MKKIIALLCALIMLAACCITTNAATLKSKTPDKEIAKKYGYDIEYNLKDGWEVPLFYIDENGYTPNVIAITTKGKLDISKYNNGEIADFYGIDILSISCHQDTWEPEILAYHFNLKPDVYYYSMTTADFYTVEEAEALFAKYDFITKSELGQKVILDIEEPVEDVPCDVNFDNTFDTMDYITVKRAYFGTYNEADMYCNKGDLNNNLEIDAIDSALMKRAYFDLFTVEE